MSFKRKLHELMTHEEDVKTFEHVFKMAVEIKDVDDMNIKQQFRKLSLNKLIEIRNRMKEYTVSNTDLKMKHVMHLLLPEVRDVDAVLKKLNYTRDLFYTKLVASARESFPSSKRNSNMDMRKLNSFIDDSIENKEDTADMAV